MSDKSFGDYTNRNVVKNSLLSTAVTGLSIEDLTHNAVLLPAVPTQELITRQDHNKESQMQTPRPSDHETSNLPSGDANFNTIRFNPPTNLNQHIFDTNRHTQINKTNDVTCSYQSKASSKSEEDFDVNEYFARLQGTRYVSAPFNVTKEDQNANLQAEENLEEINLNEPDKIPSEDVQHSLTSDIAQNFSQLPQVLPQVASVVFNSFSSMLNMRSREQTPDDREDSKGFQGVQPGNVAFGVPEVPVQVAPPPLKEPPTGIASSYRITTKKKVYAQIPGLSSGDSPIQTFSSTPNIQNTPLYFIPESNTADTSTANLQQTGGKIENIPIGFDSEYSSEISQTKGEYQNDNNKRNLEESESINVFKPVKFENPQGEKNVLPFDKGRQNIPSLSTIPQPPLTLNKQSSTSIIPPPPMFSNIPRRGSQNAVEKSILPPSVARRISANQPIMKSQPQPTVIMQENIFVPTMAPEPITHIETSTQQNFGQAFDHSTGYNTTQSIFKPQSPAKEISQPSTEVPAFPLSTPSLGTCVPVADVAKKPELSIESLFSQNQKASDASLVYPPANAHISSISLLSSFPQENKIQENMVPSTFFHPIPSNCGAILDKEEKRDPNQINNTALGQPTPVPEPPKTTGNLNYRMSKKRPQYYSGPIEGMGSISNNVKPIINPVEVSSFQGDLFTPDRSVSATNNSLYPDYNISSVPESTPFDINKPAYIETYNAYSAQGNREQIKPEFNTAFDLSRSTTEKYEQPQQESRGFGIIGSLKSKLSSIDINKIQNTVTTFFDPAYNATKIDNANINENHSYSYQNVAENYSNYPQVEPSLEVFVPNQETTFSNPYGYQMDQVQPINQTHQYYPKQDYLNQNQAQNYPNANLYAGWCNQQQILTQIPLQSSVNLPQGSNVENKNVGSDTISDTIEEVESSSKITTDINQDNFSQNVETNTQKSNTTLPEINPISLFDNQPPIPGKVTEFKNETLIENKHIYDSRNVHTKENEPLQITSDSTLKSFFDCPKFDLTSNYNPNQNKLQSKEKDIIEPTTNPIKSIFDTSLPIEKSVKESGIKLDHTFIYGSDFIRELPKTHVTNEPSSKGFFDKQTPIILPHAIKNPDDIKIFSRDESSGIVQPKRSEFIEPVFDSRSKKTTQEHIGKKLLAGDFTTIKKPDLKLNPAMLPPIKNIEIKEHKTMEPSPFSLFELSPNIPSIPLYNLPSTSSILSEPFKEMKNMRDIETKLEKMSLFENNEPKIISQPAYNLFGDTDELLDNQATDLNICETCREVNKPEGNEVDDLTTQLIENITAPIQLANPVEYPVVKDENFPVDNVFPDELTNITQDILQSMAIPPPVDLIDDLSVNNSIPNYGWSTNEPHSSKALVDHNYSYQVDTNSIGFIQDKSLFFENIPTNACDEIKAEYRNSQEEPSISTLPVAIPTAPPDEDTKSDESGLDVHSIEQDAKKDFPLYEEFSAEPSETDDDKIEYREREKFSDDSAQDDTFTNRVERFKKLETVTDSNDNIPEIRTDLKPFELTTSTSPAITIASYFDTGNYAVENHYKNSLTSPSTLTSFNNNSNTPMRIPPGFEEEYQRRLSGIPSQDLVAGVKNQISTFVPDASNPLHKIFSQTTSTVDDEIICDPKVETMIEQLIEDDTSSSKSERLPAFSSLIEPKQEKVEEKEQETASFIDKPLEEEKKVEPLADPINFFSTDESTENPDAYNNFSRLSSYFTSPPQPDHSKSFFELSQSQDHYRHKPKERFDSIRNNVKNFFVTNDIDNSYIPQNTANLSLIRDLTSPKNFNPIDENVKTVNYFTFENNNNKVKHINIGEPINMNKHDIFNNAQTAEPNLDENFDINYIYKCKYCDVTEITNTAYKIRKSMNKSPDSGKDNNNMDVKKDTVKKSMTVNFCEQNFEEDSNNGIMVTSENRPTSEYSPVKHHWFYQVDSEEKAIWRGFSVADSRALENAFNSSDLNENTLVPTDGGRFDVNVVGRLRIAVYWDDKPTNVMRCSWFYKGTTDARYVPYSESIAEKLEEEYHHGITTGEWHRRLMLPNNELVVMHGPAVMVHFLQSSPTDVFGTTPQSTTRPRVVRRGYLESEIEDTEPSNIDHLLLLCHGVGSACDMRFRPVEEVVDDFRATSLQLIQSHYKNSYDSGLVGRVEVLPISWHSSLHSGQTGVDRRLAAVTLESIPRLRNFTNDTILDVLFYTSPVFCQTIIDTVCGELNRIYSLFKKRNPDFKGGVSLGGHSLGSVILYDLLCHQMPWEISPSKDKQYVTGSAGTGQPCVKYPSLEFTPDALYALGSPIAIFECIRGVETLGQRFCLPTCKNFFNIFHPYDPIAYRIEPLINTELRDVKPFLIPHHKGRKRMHLELKDTMARVGADIKQKLIESIRSTWSSMWKTQPPNDQHLEKVVEEELEKEKLNAESKEDNSQDNIVTADMLGKLNDGRRIDHVLQEAPFEMINEYLFAMRSHVCYWESEDTMLVMLREIYNSLGVSPDCSLPQQTMTVQRSKRDDNDLVTSTEYPSTSQGSS